VTLNIDGKQKKAKEPAAGAAPRRPRRAADRRLVAEVVDEMTAWNPREFIAAFQRWHQGQISLIQLNVLALLEATGPLPMNRLADSLDISVASLTGVIDRMESRQLVERHRDAEDRRVVLVAPGEGGRKLFAEIDQRRRAGLSTLLASLSEAELRGLLEGHRALRSARAELARRFAVDKVDAMVARATATRTRKVDELFARTKPSNPAKAPEPAKEAGE
jgi:DNA-binding MarR family transcriptional regulator